MSLPFAGRVLTSTVAVGQLVGPTNPLGLVYRTRSLQVEVPVSPQMLIGLQPIAGRSASVDTGRRTYEAEVDRATRALDTITRQATMFLKFKGAAEAELPGPGTFVQVRLSGEEYSNAFLLPESTRQANDRVWVVKDGKLHSVTPETLGLAGAGWIVASFRHRRRRGLRARAERRRRHGKSTSRTTESADERHDDRRFRTKARCVMR